MHVDARTAWIAVLTWCAIVFLYGLWRSRGEGVQDPIRPSGPLDQL